MYNEIWHGSVYLPIDIPCKAEDWEFLDLFTYVTDLAWDLSERGSCNLNTAEIVSDLLHEIWCQCKGGMIAIA